MFLEDSGSSIDGELGSLADTPQNRDGLYESFDDYARSPMKKKNDSVIMSTFSMENLSVPEDNHNLAMSSRGGGSEKEQGQLQSLHTSGSHLEQINRIEGTPNINDSVTSMCKIFLPSCLRINRVLQEKGFSPLSLTDTDIDVEKRSMSVFVLDAWAESITSALDEIIERQDRQTTVAVESSLASKSVEATREAMEKHIRDLQRKLAAAEEKLAARSIQSGNLEESFEESEKKLKETESDAKRKIKNLEALVKESERKLKVCHADMEKMRTKLQSFVDKDREARARYNEVLSGSAVASIVKGVASPVDKKSKRVVGRRNPSSPEEVVRALDADRMELEQVNSELRQQVVSLSETIRDMQNGQSKKNNFSRPVRSLEDDSDDSLAHVSRDSDDYANHDGDNRAIPGSMKVLFGKLKDQQRRLEQLSHREGVLEAELRRSEEALDVYRQRASEMMEEIENLRIELDDRPTVRAYAQKQKEVMELESKLHDVIMMRKEAAEVASWRKHLSTSDRIKADKRNHELGLWIIESIPTAVVKEVLQACCRELDLSDVSELQPALEKLKAVVRTVPRMEAFITKVCGYVFDRERPRYPEGDVKEEPVMEDALPIVKKWWGQLNKGVELYKFQEAVLKELDRREIILGTQVEQSDDTYSSNKAPPGTFRDGPANDIEAGYTWETRRRAIWMKRDPRVAVSIISDLINFQLESFQNTQSYRAAAEFVANNPEQMVNRLLAHLQYIFDVKDLQGLVPKMNQIYLFVEEAKNFYGILKDSLGMKDVQNSVLISETLRRISAQNELLNGTNSSAGARRPVAQGAGAHS